MNLSEELLDDSLKIDLEDENLVEIERRICHLKTFSNLTHRRYARLLLSKIRNQLSISTSYTRKLTLTKWAHIIELKIGVPI